MDKKTKRNIGLVLAATILLALLLFIQERDAAIVSELERKSYGEGKKKETLEVTIGEEKLEDPFEIEINERAYGEQELQRVFGQAMEELPKIILGENESLDHVEQNLNLVTAMPDQPIEIRWESQRRDIIDATGEIQEENLSGEGDLVELQGLLTYGKEKALYIVNVMVYPRTLTKKEEMIESLRTLVTSSEEQSRQEAVVKLPKEVNGKTLIWEQKKEYKSIWILVLGTVAAILLWMQEKQKKQKEQEKKERQMRMDYPEIVNGIALLVGAGLTVKNAWKKIVDNYEEQKDKKKKRFAYEEMANAMREMQGGITESECYEHFGKRIGISPYVKLGTILSQNLRKGTKGLTEVLSKEAGRAYEERRQMAKKQGEEVSTKLLLPMSLMLIVVLVIVIVPAFLSISL